MSLNISSTYRIIIDWITSDAIDFNKSNILIFNPPFINLN